MGRRTQPGVVVVAVLLGASGCKSLSTGAAEHFTDDFTCPADRVEVVPRSDVEAYDVLFARLPEAKPPADVAADPGRLALFNAKQQKKRSTVNGSCEVFEAKGCGQRAIYCCSHSSQSRGGRAGRVSCSKGESGPLEPAPGAKP